MISRFWFKLASVLIWVNSVLILKPASTLSALSTFTVRLARRCIEKGQEVAGIVPRPNVRPETPSLSPEAQNCHPSLHGPPCRHCGHVRLDHWGPCAFEGCDCTSYDAGEAL